MVVPVRAFSVRSMLAGAAGGGSRPLLRRRVAGVASATLVASLLQAVPVAVVAHAATVKAPREDVVSRPDAAAAAMAAKTLGHKVEISGLGSESSTVWANPDGSRTLAATAGVSRWQDSGAHQADGQ
jgi:hypothetical protein